MSVVETSFSARIKISNPLSSPGGFETKSPIQKKKEERRRRKKKISEEEHTEIVISVTRTKTCSREQENNDKKRVQTPPFSYQLFPVFQNPIARISRPVALRQSSLMRYDAWPRELARDRSFQFFVLLLLLPRVLEVVHSR
jgi:hypothetical protein